MTDKKVIAPISLVFGVMMLISLTTAKSNSTITSDSKLSDETAALQNHTIELAELMPIKEKILLKNNESAYYLFLPLSSRITVTNALLHLTFTNSISLLKDRSQLGVSINDKVIAQLPLQPDRPNNVVDLVIPIAALKVGYNKISFDAQQHYTLECEDPTAPELWTQVDTNQSWFKIQTRANQLQPNLAYLDSLIDRRLWQTYELDVVTATADLSDTQLSWGAIASQGAALRLDYIALQPHHIALDQLAFPANSTQIRSTQTEVMALGLAKLLKHDAIIIGTKADLEPYLAANITEDIANSFLGIYANPANQTQFILVISGRNQQEVTQAATLFAHLSFPLPNVATMQVPNIAFPSLPKYTARATLHENSRYQFNQLGYRTRTLWGNKVNNENKIALIFWMAPDLFASDKVNVELSLHFSYGAALRSDSVMNLTLNGNFENAVLLDDKHGGVFRDYKVYLPVRSLQPGKNVLEFEPQLTSMVSDRCEVAQADNLAVTLFDDSEITFPDAGHYVRMPDMSLLAKTGFPYTILPNGDDLSIKLTQQDSSVVAATWTLLAKLSQLIGIPLYDAQLTYDAPAVDRNVIYIGASDTLAPSLVAGSPLVFSQYQPVPYPIAMQSPENATHLQWWHTTKQYWSRWLGIETVRADSKMMPLLQAGDLGTFNALAQFESPYYRGKTAMILTAASALSLYEGVNTLVKPIIWDNLQGGVVLWETGDTQLRSLEAMQPYHIGDLAVNRTLSYYLSQYPVYTILAVIGLLVSLSVILSLLLRRFKQRHHPNFSSPNAASNET